MPTVVSNAPIISQKSVVRHDPRDAEIAELKAKLDAATRLAPSNFQSNAGPATYLHALKFQVHCLILRLQLKDLIQIVV